MKKVLEPVIRSGFCLILILAAGAGCTRLTPHPEGKKCSKLEKRRVFISQMEDPCRKKELPTNCRAGACPRRVIPSPEYYNQTYHIKKCHPERMTF